MIRCRSTRQAGSMVGSKTWTVLDSLELLDHDAVLMPLEQPSGTAAAVRGSQAAQSGSETAPSSAPGLPQALQSPPAPLTTRISDAQDDQECTRVVTRHPCSLSSSSIDLHWALGMQGYRCPSCVHFHASYRFILACCVAEPRGEQLRVVARTSSGISDHREGDWVSVQPAQGPSSLPKWTARQPSILWLNVKPGTA